MPIVRYRYRAYPEPGQVQALARAFGCARVVFNDAIRLRDDAFKAGEKLFDTDVQRRVVTLAKLTPEREWLAEVSSVVLVQACRTRAARSGTGSTRCPGSAGAGRWVIPGSGRARTTGSRSGSPATGSASPLGA
ncbi:helix-turn-helix domain-containing protein [Frankia sp. Ag45/Mut15]|uniref:Helix-turn-helix domain-containing protein n=1 Tax=Frankia umida TaxID=573489 RepID=A0ABT0JS43_9ACTN|nr:helix-turn-helix domain-containing protein [Frankia umida]MCK9874370.1 helix-turn-helix domain-containing protein [Frankia umida]